MMKRTIALTVLVFALISLGLIAPASAQGATWYAQYYNNPTLSGTPVLSRYEGNISFNWGTGTPAAEVQADNFSARFAADIAFQAGTYRFFMLADDNARVTFNFSQTVIDTFGTGQVGQTVSGDVVIGAAGVYHIQIDYREVESNAFLYFSYANAATNPQPPFTVPGVTPPTGGSAVGLPAPWTAQYYNNTSLSGDPAAIVTVPTLNFNVGTNAPIGSVTADNWSARFTSVQNLSGGMYTVRAVVDDGIRVFINGALIINQLSGAVGQTLTAQVTLPAGANNFQVDYVEYTANAYLDLQLIAPSAPVVPTSSPITGASAIVTAYRLNVRQSPDPFAAILTRINRNEQYAVAGRNAAGSWYLLQVGTIQGWASASYLSVINGAGVPIVDGTVVQPTTAPPAAGGITVLASPYTVNIRSGASTSSSRIGRLPAGQSALLIGRNAANQWWQINYNGIVGWVTAQYTTIVPAGANIGSIPITG